MAENNAPLTKQTKETKSWYAGNNADDKQLKDLVAYKKNIVSLL